MVCFGPGLKWLWGMQGSWAKGRSGGGTSEGKEVGIGGGTTKREEGPSRWKAVLLWARVEMAVGVEPREGEERAEEGAARAKGGSVRRGRRGRTREGVGQCGRGEEAVTVSTSGDKMN